MTSAPRDRRRRDRHGRGLRGPLVPARVEVRGRVFAVPLHRTRGQRFDDLVLDAVEHLEERWQQQLEGVEFAVEDVPELPADLGPDGLLDTGDDVVDAGVPLSRVLPAGTAPDGTRLPPRVVVYRRPLEARAGDGVDLADLVHDVVVDQVARLLGVDPDVLDPPQD